MFRRRVCRAVSNNLRKKLDNLRKRFIIICGAKNEREKRRTRMKYIKQILIILTISFVGELLKQLLPLPVPASIYGMVILFVLLLTKVIKLEAVKEVGDFMIEIMPVMFIPAGVGLMASWGVLQPMLVQVSIITVISLVLVMAFGGRITQFIIRRGKKKTGKKEQD